MILASAVEEWWNHTRKGGNLINEQVTGMNSCGTLGDSIQSMLQLSLPRDKKAGILIYQFVPLIG